ncbi:hypothetical protein Cgig2_023979 [Carnegiea gigantea]|uniref:Uncharacterized protein n=1 Tax=Carnegiea gigantea TaxID=171969 RepID=A0A9Q1KC47_9CARY|nr:hypothetical protein Cgig2_023979 [Carnegiea gigantea]
MGSIMTLDGLVLVTQRFVDRHATMTQPARKHMVARSLFTPRLLLPETIDNEGQNSSLSTPVCGGNGKMACGGVKTLRQRFVAPGVLGRNRTPTSTLTPREMYAAECDEKDDQTRGVTKKAKSATHVTLQPLSKVGEKNTQQPLISIGSGTSNGKDQGSNNGKDQDKGDTSSPTMKRKRNPNARPRGMNLVKEVARLKDGGKEGKQPTVAEIFKAIQKAKTGSLEGQDAEKYEEIISTADKHPEFSQFELIEKCFGPQDHYHVVCFGHGATPKDVWGSQPSKVNLMSLTGHVDALESNHQKKIEEIKTTQEVQMAEKKESRQQYMAKIEDAHHKDMATVGDKLELLTKLVLHQMSHEMHLSGMYHWLVFLFFGLVFLITFCFFLLNTPF